MAPRRLWLTFEVADVTVTLAGNKHHVDVRVVVGEQDTRAGVDHFQLLALRHVIAVPDGVLPLTHPTEACGEHVVGFAREDDLRRFAALVALGFALDFTADWVDDADLLVLRRGGKQRAVEVPRAAVDGVRVAVKLLERTLSANVPNEDLRRQTKAMFAVRMGRSCIRCRNDLGRRTTGQQDEDGDNGKNVWPQRRYKKKQAQAPGNRRPH